ncbi:MAG: hypothetical protein AAGG65_14445 [Pseudomonadota bacterium]
MKLCFGCISARGDVRIEFVEGLVGILRACAQMGIDTTFMQFTGALVEDARDMMATRFSNGTADALVMLDDDIFLDPRVFKRMLAVERDTVGCYYPQRHLAVEAFADHIRQGMTTSDAAMRASPLVGPDPDGADSFAISEVEWIGSGALLIRRRALETMIKLGKVGKERFRTPQDIAEMWGFFSRLRLDDGVARSEDASFCLRARQCGIAIYAYKGPGVLHSGSFQFGSHYP